MSPPQKNNKKTWLFRSLLLMTSCIFCLVLVEIMIRIFLPVSPYKYQPDDELIFELIPSTERVFRRSRHNGGQIIPVVTNSHGYRGREISPTKTRQRIVVYGDSFIQGEFSILENTFVCQLERRLNELRTGPVEVINAGISAYGPDQLALKMRRELDEFQPDLVVLSIYAGNDYGDLVRNKIFRPGNHGALTCNHYKLSPALLAEMNAAAHPRGLYRFHTTFRFREYYGRLVHKVRRLFQADALESESYIASCIRNCNLEYENYVLDNNNEVSDPFHDHYDADIAVDPDALSSRYKTKLMELVIRDIKHRLAERQIPMFLLIIPSPIDVCEGYEYQVDADLYPQYSRSRLTDTLEEIARRQDIACLNLFTVYRKQDPLQLYFHRGNDHWNDAGQKLAAHRMADLIISTQLL